MDDKMNKKNSGVYAVSGGPQYSNKAYANRRKQKKCCRKYGTSLKHLLPWRPPRKDKRSMPANKAGLCSLITVNWLNRLMVKAYREGLKEEDLYDVASPDTIADNAERVVRIWEEELDRHGDKASLFGAMTRFLRTRLICAMFFYSISTILQFAGPTYLQQLILSYSGDQSQSVKWGVSLVFILFGTQLFRNFFFGAAYIINLHSATRAQAALEYLVYAKVLRLRASDERALGQIVNFCSSEQERIFDVVNLGAMLISTPVMFSLSVGYTYYELGYWSLLGNLMILSFYPIMGAIAAVISRVRTRTVISTDKRIGLMGEILNSIKFIKMYAWEDCFIKNLHNVRQKERRELQISAFLQSFSNTISPAISILAAVVTFIVQTATGRSLFSTEAFTVYSAFQSLQFTVSVLPFGIKTISESKVAFRKMEEILLKPESQPPSWKDTDSDNRIAVDIKDANFVWEDIYPMSFTNKAFEGDDEQDGPVMKETNLDDGKSWAYTETLRNVNLTIAKGELIGICGPVGSGKSSLLSTIIGDMNKVRGGMVVRGSQAIVTQQAWIFNETLRENILFGLPYDEKRYREVVHVCSLKRDFELLANGDLTEIGERGSNLSGGQKQRVNLARAVYANKDILLLDDPLSAVDSRVAKHIFNKCIKGYLKGKTILLVTHGIQFLEECDQVVFMKGGVISELGTHLELAALGRDYAQMLSYDPSREKKKAGEEETNVEEITDLDEEPPAGGGALTEAEQHKPLGFSAYVQYFKFAGGYCALFGLGFVVTLFILTYLFSSIWLSIWLNAGDGLESERKRNETLYNMTYSSDDLTGSVTGNKHLEMYQLVYGLSFIAIIVSGLVKGCGFAYYLILGASRMHDTMFRKIMRCPVAFFDVTPAGRVLQRFSKDMDEVDVRVPYYVEFVWQNALSCIGMMLIICVVYPVYTAVLGVSIILFAFLEVWLNKGLQQNKTLDNIRRAPVISHISSSMAGIAVIRTYGREDVLMERFCRRVDHSLASDLIYRSSVRWFTFRMDIICVVLVTLTALETVLTRGDSTTASGGLALSSIFAVCNIIPYVMQMASEMQARFTSVERILEYTSDLPEEAPLDRKDSPKPQGWPAHGGVAMEDVELRYRPGLPLVLRRVNAVVRPGEKVGVVGRTGAGKSSLISTLLRFTELAGGRILVDGVDIAQLGLRELRSSIAIIPQDPVLFEGTMRFNLDPFNLHKDEAVWQALEKAHVKAKVEREEKQLLAPVSGGGQNLSVGEKQLICLARAVLRRNKILLLDEATASVDVETDFLIQRTIREAFHDCTVITIAHRLHTVATYDRVMVMDAGQVVEFDSPAALLAREGSVFRLMTEAAGITNLQSQQQH